MSVQNQEDGDGRSFVEAGSSKSWHVKILAAGDEEMVSDAGPLSSEAVDPSPEVEELTLSNSTNLKLVVCVCVRV